MRKSMKLLFVTVLTVVMGVPGFAAGPNTFDVFISRMDSQLTNKSMNIVFDDFLKSYWTYLMETYPEWATYVGYPGQNARLSDNSLARIRADKKNIDKLAAFLAKIKREKLDLSQQLTFDLIVDSTKLAQRETQFPSELLALNQLDNGPQSRLQLLMAMPREKIKDMEDRLTRLRGFAQVIKNDQAKLVEGLLTGITVPFPAMRRAPADLMKLIPKDVAKSPYFEEMSNFPKDVLAQDRERIMAEARRVIETEIYPTIQELNRFLVNEYLPKTRRTIGLSDLPNGRDWYDLAVKMHTTTEMSAEEVHQLGLKEVDRLSKELDKVKVDLKFKGTLKQFIVYMKNDPKFRFKSEDDMLSQYRSTAKRIDGELPRFFSKLPRQTYGVKPVPAFMNESNAGAYYEGGAASAGRAGFFMINTHLPKNQHWWEVESLTSHEAVPGHHLQIALAQELDELPELRKHGGYTAFTEGWALYAESLGYEIGLYQNPAMKFGQITNEIWRAVRLVVDTGMHSKGWSRQQAIDYMKSYIAKEEHEIVVEIDRYIVWPGQALAYKVGQLKFQELKERAKDKLGSKFDVRVFHDRLLDGGALPLRVLQSRIDNWVTNELAKPVTN